MKFIEYLNGLQKEYSNNYLVRKNGTILLAPGKLPKSKHMLFKPLKQDIIDEFLISHFNLDFPKEYIDFLKYSNGASLFTIKVNAGKFSFASSLLEILGLPLTPPFNRPLDMEEPFDIRVENLSKHKNIPNTWMKCAVWIKVENIGKSKQTDIFIDTATNRVYACEKNHKDILNEWNNLDECFCNIVDSFRDLKDEYKMKI